MPDLHEPRDWKDLFLNYDALIDPGPDYVRECQICLTNAQRQALLGLIQALEWSGGYYSPTDAAIDDDLVDAFADDIAWRLSDMACNDTYTSRINDEGTYQISYDGGVTWTDAPTLDPRNGTPIYAGLSGDDGDAKKCQGANNLISYFKNVVEEIGVTKDTAATFSDLVAVLIGLLLILGIISGGWLFALLGALVTIIYNNYDATTWRAAFTDDRWQTLICIVYAHEQDDASFTAADVVDIQQDIMVTFSDSIARTFFFSMFNIGANALTNAARSEFGGSLDCDACGCDVSSWEIDPYFGGSIVGTGSNYIDVQSSGSQLGIRLIADKPRGCCMPSGFSTQSGTSPNYWYWNTCSEPYTAPPLHGPQIFPQDQLIVSVGGTIPDSLNGVTRISFY